jgi:hypothetical protein
MAEDPLSSLLADKTELDRSALSEILVPYVKVDRASGSPILLPKFTELTNSGKIIVFLLARKAAKNLGLGADAEGASPMEISKEAGIHYDSVKPTVSQLRKERILAKDGKSYFVPDHAIVSARRLIEKRNRRG